MMHPLPQRIGSAALAALLTSEGARPAAPATPAAPKTQYLHAGQVCVSAEPQSIVFILGSCVAVCLWDPTTKIGGATHFLLPLAEDRSPSSPRYGNVAIPVLIHKLVEAGARLDRLRAKIFGGGCLLNSAYSKGQNADYLGARNAEISVQILRKERIPIDFTDVGGGRGRRIEFHTASGDASVKEL